MDWSASSTGAGRTSQEGLPSLPVVSDVLQAITTYNIGPVTELLEKAAYFSMLFNSAPEAQSGEPRRFKIATRQEPGGKLTGWNVVGDPAASFSFRWGIIPPDWEARPDVRPPLRPPLTPEVPQRFELYDAVCRFRHAGDSGFRAYGIGRTYPAAGPGGSRLRVGAVLDIQEGFGQLSHLAGTVVASGELTPPDGFKLNLMIRVMDASGGMQTQSAISPAARAPDPEPGVTYIAFIGKVDPTHPVTLRFSLTEGLLGSNVFELMRLVELDFDTDAVQGLRSKTTAGAVVGSVSAKLSFNPLALCPITPIQTFDGVFEFQASDGRAIGKVFANMTEGRSFRTRLEGHLLPVFRFGGFGEIGGGTGEFAGVGGIMSMNSVISVQPRTLSNLYVLRLDDPDGRYRASISDAGSR